MAKPEWGARYACFSCGCKFYDLNRPEPLCPRCGADQREATSETRSQRPTRPPPAPAEGEVEQEPVVDLDETVSVSDVLLAGEGEEGLEEELEEDFEEDLEEEEEEY